MSTRMRRDGASPFAAAGPRTPRRAFTCALLASAFAGGCAIVEPSAEDAATDLERARSRWEATGVRDYTLTIERFCYCALVGPVHVLVQDGVAVAALPEDDTAVGVTLADYPPVEGLFDLVESALRRQAHRMTVVYHPTLGYPTEIDIDYAENVDDEEVRLEAALQLGTGGVTLP